MRSITQKFSLSFFLCALYIQATHATDAVNATTAANFTALADAIEHATTGCGAAVVRTPRPGTQFADPLSASGGATESFFAQAARQNVTWASSVSCTSTGRTHALVPASPGKVNSVISSGLVSDNWSGYQIANTAQYAQAGWTVPQVVLPHPTYSTTGYFSSVWSGIGGGYGANNGPLIQSGTEQDFDDPTLPPGANYYFWYEIVGGSNDTGGERQVSIQHTPAVGPGDTVGNVVIYNPTTSKATLSVCNFTYNTCFQIDFPNQSTPGNTVEWITEAPQRSGYITPLADYGLVNFVGACWVAVYAAGATCSPIAAPGGNTPLLIVLQQYALGQYQPDSTPAGLATVGNASSFHTTYIQPVKKNNN